MKKYRTIIIVAFLFLVGAFSIAVSFGDFFFTTAYYKTPLEAYNENSSFNAIQGDTSADRAIGTLMLDEATCLFIGEMDEHSFVINEMIMEGGKYAAKGTSIFYDLREESDGQIKNQTETSTETVNWGVMYSQAEVDALSDVDFCETYTHSSGANIYLVVYKK